MASYLARKNGRAKRFAQELKIVEALRKRIADGEGWTRITMKSDGQEIDIAHSVDNKYHVSFPCYYGDSDYRHKAPYKPLDRWFNGLDEIAEFLMNEGWKRYWNQ